MSSNKHVMKVPVCAWEWAVERASERQWLSQYRTSPIEKNSTVWMAIFVKCIRCHEESAWPGLSGPWCKCQHNYRRRRNNDLCRQRATVQRKRAIYRLPLFLWCRLSSLKLLSLCQMIVEEDMHVFGQHQMCVVLSARLDVKKLCASRIYLIFVSRFCTFTKQLNKVINKINFT